MRQYGRDQKGEGLAALRLPTPHLGRLQLRLGAQHPVVNLYRRLTDAGNEVSALIPSTVPGTPKEARDSDLAVRSWAGEMEQFIEAAHTLVATSASALKPADAHRRSRL